MSSPVPSSRLKTLTASDVTEYNEYEYRALYVLTDGNLNLVDHYANTTLIAVTAGQIVPFSPFQVLSTSTTATCAGLG